MFFLDVGALEYDVCVGSRVFISAKILVYKFSTVRGDLYIP